MRRAFITILRWNLKKLAQWTLSRHRPGVIAITGSVGKTSAKLAIASVLATERHVRCSHGNLNNDLGLPLTILGDWSEEEFALVSREIPAGKKLFRKLAFWGKVIVRSFAHLAFFGEQEYPEILVLEYGADRPDDLNYLLTIAKPNVSVITAIGDIPVHVEFFTGPDDVAREKARLIEGLPSTGFAVLNYDDESVMNLKDRTRGHVITFGMGKGAEIRIANFENRAEVGPSASFRSGQPMGIAFRVEYGGRGITVRLPGVFGKTHAYAAGAAAAVGLIFGMSLQGIAEKLKAYTPAPGRSRLIPGIKGTFIIDDTYNASPLSMHAALDTLKDLPGKRKIAVLGDMRELGKYTMQAHERVGRLAAKAADVLVTIGPRAKFIAEAARGAGLSKKNIWSFDSAEDAQTSVQDLIKKGDLVLVKASRAVQLEKIVEEIQALPETT